MIDGEPSYFFAPSGRNALGGSRTVCNVLKIHPDTKVPIADFKGSQKSIGEVDTVAFFPSYTKVPAGMYFIRLITETGVETIKVVRE